MIQRIQTIYLLLAAVLAGVCLCGNIGYLISPEGAVVADLTNLRITTLADGESRYQLWALSAVLGITIVLQLFGIFLFKARALQMRLCSFCMILLVGWYLAYAAFAWLLASDLEASFRPSFFAAIPAVNLILMYLSFRGIWKDEMLVKSLDRLR